MEVYLIRHTTPEIEKGICYGFSDVPLAGTFEDEWNVIQSKLPERIDSLFSSPLTRCKSLSLKLAKHFDLRIQEDARLKEMNFGAWEMKRWDEIDQEKLTTWMNNYKTERCPAGESYEDVINRVKHFIEDLLSLDSQQAMIVTHGGVIKCFDTILKYRDGISLSVEYGEIHRYTIQSTDWAIND